jgi:hypothetical protein
MSQFEMFLVNTILIILTLLFAVVSFALMFKVLLFVFGVEP